MNDPAANPADTMHVGPLGSTIHVLRADADTVAELAAVDWCRHLAAAGPAALTHSRASDD